MSCGPPNKMLKVGTVKKLPTGQNTGFLGRVLGRFCPLLNQFQKNSFRFPKTKFSVFIHPSSQKNPQHHLQLREAVSGNLIFSDLRNDDFSDYVRPLIFFFSKKDSSQKSVFNFEILF